MSGLFLAARWDWSVSSRSHIAQPQQLLSEGRSAESQRGTPDTCLKMEKSYLELFVVRRDGGQIEGHHYSILQYTQ